MIFMFKLFATVVVILSGLVLTLSTVIQGSCGIYLLELNDSYGDGWNGGFGDIYSMEY